MIRRNGPQTWRNVHVTEQARLADLIDVDNAAPGGEQLRGMALLRQAARDLDALIQQARAAGVRVRALGAGWALTDIAITDGWLVNTKLLNGCFDVPDHYFHDAYPQDKRACLVVAQCGISVAELNAHLEVTATAGFPRALRTAGIGAGQTIAGAISGNTHGAAVNFGAMPDFVAGLQIVTGRGRSVWVERASDPVLNADFVTALDADLVRDDDVLGAAAVSFGAFGLITAVAIETEPLYQLLFPPVSEISHEAIGRKLDSFDAADPPGLHHYEFIFDPYSRSQRAIQTVGTRVPYEQGHAAPKPVWIVRDDRGFAPGVHTSRKLLRVPVIPAADKTALQFRQYRERCILGDVRATPGQLFTATITNFEGFTEFAFAVSVHDASLTMRIATDVVRALQLPCISQVRMVHPTRTLLGFTRFAPRTVVFAFGLARDRQTVEFGQRITAELHSAGVEHTYHWSKNTGIDAQLLQRMYGADRVATWRQARSTVFGGDTTLMQVFDNAHTVRAGLNA